jgi:hypothetical protein
VSPNPALDQANIHIAQHLCRATHLSPRTADLDFRQVVLYEYGPAGQAIPGPWDSIDSTSVASSCRELDFPQLAGARSTWFAGSRREDCRHGVNWVSGSPT